ncbi:MAG TPA: lipid-A-disaccharide synthase [Pyrinomonadaceae bacterium]|nr:lipid-A-disaccharide synthase [Pyrinomonadaceae bacterium]
MAEGHANFRETVRLMVVAGEESGDAHAAALVAALRDRAPEVNFEFFGSAGARLREAGVEPVVREDDLAITGLLEIGRALPRFVRAFRALVREAGRRRPAAAVLVDWPDFNLRLARALKRRGVKVVYYISPQLWAWRSHRVRQIRRDVDLLVAILPFEPEWYARRGFGRVEFVGHPLAGRAPALDGREEFLRLHGLDARAPLVALLPGSRRKEFERILPPMLDAAARVRGGREGAQFVVALADTRTREEAERVIASHEDASRAVRDGKLIVVRGETREALAASDAAAVCSGTATLEAALAGTPLVVVYKESFVNWHTLGRLITVEHYGLVNLVAGRRVATELLQDDFTGETLARELLKLLDPTENARVRGELREAVARLGDGGASARAADAVLRVVGREAASAPPVNPPDDVI